MVKLGMRNIFNLISILLLFSQVAMAENKTALPLAELSTYVAKLEKADSYEVRRFFLKKDPSFKNGLVILNVMCGQGNCTNYVFSKNDAGTFEFVGNMNGVFEESAENKATPNFPDIWTKTKSANESELIKWSYNEKMKTYEVK